MDGAQGRPTLSQPLGNAREIRIVCLLVPGALLHEELKNLAGSHPGGREGV